MADREEISGFPVECRRCGQSKIVPRIGSIGDKSRASGYHPVLSGVTILWLCPECVLVLRPHIQEIVNVTGGENIYWSHMIGLLKDVPDRNFA